MENNINNFKLFMPLSCLLSIILIASNITALKFVHLGSITLTGGFIVFPFVYIINNILIECYGYKNTRQAIWYSFGCAGIFSILTFIVTLFPSAQNELDNSYDIIFSHEPRIIAASLISFVIADLTCNYVLAKSKIHFDGKYLFFRIMICTMVSISLGILIFFLLAFYGKKDTDLLFTTIVIATVKKISFQFLLYPVTLFFITKVKRIEKIDIFDYNTSYNPFTLDNVYEIENYRKPK